MTLRVGLSGGIGSGKSTVAARLASLGAVVVDADAVAREVVAPGTAGLGEIEQRFGPDVLAVDGTLDRTALGEIVFGDEAARRDLEAITHPRIRRRSAELMDAAPAGAVVVHDVPLLVEMGLTSDYALTVIVDVPEQERLRRLVEQRGMPREAALARIRAQASDAERASAADVLLDNSGTVEAVHDRVDELWAGWLAPFAARLAAGGRGPRTADPSATGLDADERLLGRLRAALGEVAMDHREDVPELVLPDVSVVDRPDTRRALLVRGFLVGRHPREGPAGGGGAQMLVSADPAQPVCLALREG